MTVGSGIAVRPATPADEPFVDALLAEAAAEVLTAVPEPLRAGLIDLQVRARRSGYAVEWPDAVDRILLLDGEPVGRLLVAESVDTLHVIDVRVAAGQRGQGVGCAALTSLLTEADVTGRRVRLRVARTNPAVSLYRRLGFVEASGQDGAGTDLALVRMPTGHAKGRR